MKKKALISFTRTSGNSFSITIMVYFPTCRFY